MQKKSRIYFLSSLTIAALLIAMFSVSFTYAQGQNRNVAHAASAVSARPATSKVVAQYSVNMHNLPAEPSSSIAHPARLMPLLHMPNKSGAAQNKNAPHFQGFPALGSGPIPTTPPTTAKFKGMADSGTICGYFGTGCQPPDMALGASPQWVFQGVNTSWAVYDTHGAIQSGWPKNSQMFFNVPNPPNNCDPAGPFLSDPRAFYDPNDGRFWAATLQIEGALGVGVNCPLQSLYWIAVSQTNDPNGTWNVYAFDMQLGTTNVADYTQFGFDAHAIYFNANMFNMAGSAYVYDELFGANKAKMEAGQSVTAFGFTNLTANGVLVDTVQPVETEVPTNEQLGLGLFVNTFNMNGDGTHDCFTTACSGIVVWSMTNPGTHSASLSGLIVPTSQTYISPPNADQPTCTQCVETIDTRITATPVYSKGTISWSIDTAAMNKTQVVPAILWGQVTPQIVDGHLKGASIYQSNYFGFEGDQAASFGALMNDTNGDLIMIYDTMSSTLNPSTAYTGRRVTFPLGFFHDAGKFLQIGVKPTGDSRWGDYEATSYDGFSTDNIWMASQYSGANTDWHTVIGETQFRLK
jgi:hypothetical protein